MAAHYAATGRISLFPAASSTRPYQDFSRKKAQKAQKAQMGSADL